jgi:hypothetical protein
LWGLFLPLAVKIKRFFVNFTPGWRPAAAVLCKKRPSESKLPQKGRRQKGASGDGLSIGRLHCVAVLTASLHRHYYYLSLSLFCHVCVIVVIVVVLSFVIVIVFYLYLCFCVTALTALLSVSPC